MNKVSVVYLFLSNVYLIDYSIGMTQGMVLVIQVVKKKRKNKKIVWFF